MPSFSPASCRGPVSSRECDRPGYPAPVAGYYIGVGFTDSAVLYSNLSNNNATYVDVYRQPQNAPGRANQAGERQPGDALGHVLDTGRPGPGNAQGEGLHWPRQASVRPR